MEIAETGNIDIVKRGETCIQIRLRRSPKGVAMTVKVHPLVEEFIRSCSTGEMADVAQFGRHWQPLNRDDRLLFYVNNEGSGLTFGAVPSPDGGVIRLDKIGEAITSASDGGGNLGAANVVNLSFLRLRGVSEGDGVTFYIPGVFTLEALRNMSERLSTAARYFYIHHLRPVDLTVTVSTQELQM